MRARILAILLLIPLAACSGTGRPINPGSGVIKIKAWRILAINDHPGEITNQGSRLTNLDISQIINALQANAPQLYGQNVSFQWDGIVRDRVNTMIPINAGAMRAGLLCRLFVPSNNIWTQNSWDTKAVNIYFVGRLEPQTPPSQVPNDCPMPPMVSLTIGATLDPGTPVNTVFGTTFLDTFTDIPPFIMLNDRGCNSFFSLCEAPALTIKEHALEHEMTHYLAHFNSRTFGQPPMTRMYTSGEHITDPMANNILRPSVSKMNPLPLVIPGTAQPASEELGEIWSRINAGKWNLR